MIAIKSEQSRISTIRVPLWTSLCMSRIKVRLCMGRAATRIRF
jgi:hypothetical protein